MGVGNPINNLALASGGRAQRRVIQVNASINDTNRHATTIPGWVGGNELRRTDIAGGHVGVFVWRRGAWGSNLRRFADRFRAGIFERDDFVDVGCLDTT